MRRNGTLLRRLRKRDKFLNNSTVLIQNKPLKDTLLDRDLAKLGDAYLNFAYSLAVSLKTGRPCGLRVSNKILADAIKRAGLRSLLPHRLSSHDIGGAGESLTAYALLKGYITTEEIVQALREGEDAVEVFTRIFEKIAKCRD